MQAECVAQGRRALGVVAIMAVLTQARAMYLHSSPRRPITFMRTPMHNSCVIW